METDILLLNWSVQKGKLQKRYSWLTDKDLVFEDGRKDEMLRKIQIKLGKTKEQLYDIIAAL